LFYNGNILHENSVADKN